jgi:hypothetical protein
MCFTFPFVEDVLVICFGQLEPSAVDQAIVEKRSPASSGLLLTVHFVVLLLSKVIPAGICHVGLPLKLMSVDMSVEPFAICRLQAAKMSNVDALSTADAGSLIVVET